MAGRAPFLPEEVARYIREHRCASRRCCASCGRRRRRCPWSGMQIGADQGQFMRCWCKRSGAQRCLEIGTYTGYSALAVALALPEDGSLVCCDVSEEWTAVGKPFWKKAGVEKKIDLRIGPALETLKRLQRPVRLRLHRRRQGQLPEVLRALPAARAAKADSSPSTIRSGPARSRSRSQKDADTVALRQFNDASCMATRASTLSMLPLGDGVTLALSARFLK